MGHFEFLNYGRRRIAAISILILASGGAAGAWGDSPYATAVIAQNGAFGPAQYNDPLAVLGEPTRIAINYDPLIGTSPYHIKIVEPAYNLDPAGNKVITTLARKSNGTGGYTYGAITVEFDHPVVDEPTNPYGIDLNVFGNSFYNGSGYVSDTTDMRSYELVGGIFAEPVVISVSPDNINWYTYASGPYGDTAFPTQGHRWSGEQYDLTGNGWLPETTDFTKPVNPTVADILGAPGQTISTAHAIEAYVGSGGGTGIDLAESGFAWVKYVRVEATAAFRDGEIDGFADVRPALLGEALSITPRNVTDGTPLYFQAAAAPAQTLLAAEFTDLSGPAQLATRAVSNAVALAALPAGELVASYQLDVTPLLGNSEISLVANYHFSAGDDYHGDGRDLSLLSWDSIAWTPLAFIWDNSAGLGGLVDAWTAASATLAVLRLSNDLAGDFNQDGTVDAADFTVWRDGLGGRYSADDYYIWKSNFGATQLTSSAAAALPEPAWLVLLASGIACLGLFRFA